MRSPTPARIFWLTLVVAGLALGIGGWLLEPSLQRTMVRIAFVSVACLALFALSLRFLRWYLWRVGRRLAFSYFLIGVLPIPMVAAVGAISLYLLSGYFLSHQYRTAVATLHSDLEREARTALAHFDSRVASLYRQPEEGLALYVSGRRVGGGSQAPESWPSWAEPGDGDSPRMWLLENGGLAIAATAIDGSRAALAYFDGPLGPELARRSGVWVTFVDPSKRAPGSSVTLQLGSGEYALANMSAGTDQQARDRFLGIDGTETWKERPILWWGEVAGPLLRLADGTEISEWMTASLNGTVASLEEQMFSTSAELNAAVWASLIGVTGLLSSIYLIAVAMALFMIYSLSRAVNRLSLATDAVRSGDFSKRIPVRRKDQIGDLQHSFNDMIGNLETLVDTAAQKELIEKELVLARDLQESLLPAELPATERVEFSTLFEPSAAIGGDYFDILRIDADRLAIVIADVSGHGLPTGLRMAMLKAALVILVEEQKPPSEILRRLNSMVRAEKQQRFFVTATIAVVDFSAGTLEITNAGHPPTYLLRNGEVQEILLAGSPLGALDENYRHERIDLEAGDVAVWLSDGLIEATNPEDEVFGYDATVAALEGSAESATAVRNRLLDAVRAHTAGRSADDDRTLVAMHYFPGRATSTDS